MSSNEYDIHVSDTPVDEWKVTATMNGETVYKHVAVPDWDLKQSMETARKCVSYLRKQNE